MKRNKKIPLVLVILIVVLIIFIISKIVVNKNSKIQQLEKIYEELISSQSYQFEWEQNDNNKTIMAKNGKDIIIEQYSKEEESTIQSHSKTLIKDEITYFILPERKEYYVYAGNNVDQTSFLTDGIKDIMSKEYSKGSEKVRGKKYDYEEYNGVSMFLISNSIELDENEVKTRFYFDNKGKIVYIKTIYKEQQELLKVNLTNTVDSSVFDIPSDYAENSNDITS